jgi:hypothetical protein
MTYSGDDDLRDPAQVPVSRLGAGAEPAAG